MILDVTLFMMTALLSCYSFYEILSLGYKIQCLESDLAALELDLAAKEEFVRKYIRLHESAIEQLRNAINKKMPEKDIEYPIHTKVAQDIKDETERMSKR